MTKLTQQSVINQLNQSEIRQEFIDNKISHIWLFGSAASQTNTQSSDIDILYQRDDTLPRRSGLL
jgi:predicted nucleotidyltransferase